MKIKKGCQKGRERYQNLSKEEKEKRNNMVIDVTKNLSEDEKQKLFEYRTKHFRMRINAFS